ncbi:MAG TPA: hypothetical protein VEA80_07695 [Vitreimonas sp.]|uniref:hypothetical protein n=1 Tax=Vitreimonas sp. TaxID=3069702 RepID=UPI002D310E0C|nr:hypothetical protein [Vitreimonas sp.]HYD87341.1 hypothetical protein [Vitreimonas sp.]
MSKWVDNSDYFGPDRRKRSGSKLWNERRRRDEAGDLPPLGAMLRRLRVQMVSLTPEGVPHTLQLIAGAIAEANRQNFRQCAAALYSADSALRQSGSSAASIADAHVLDAMEHAGSRR